MLENEDYVSESPETTNLSDWDDDAFAAFAGEAVEEEPLDELLPPAEDLQRMLSALSAVEEHVQAVADELPEAGFDESGRTISADDIRLPELGQVAEQELAEAFVQDASRGVALLDQAMIDLESGEGDREAATATICREMHTLKGAASTIGLADMGRYLHEVEDFVQAVDDVTSREFVETMVTCVDTVRKQIAQLAASPSSDQKETSSPAESIGRLDGGSDVEDAISVKASQLDRMLDMLTSLVMLRNRRESRVEQLRRVHEEVARCGSRLREVERRITAAFGGHDQDIRISDHSNPLNEVGSDLLEISRNLQESFEPVAEENVAVTNFIRQFRQALVTILRMPVSGLFRRLQRAALDAARVEGKRVRLQVAGSDVGLERSVQERLFDPLLHIIRNAVGHGIELPAEREASGKDPVGTITLEACGSPNTLVLTIQDDGKGLNYDALRKRGFEQGLLSSDREPTEKELAQLIFQRGLSTRETTNAVAGRGIGMDVVAETLERMHAWVDVDSEPGRGTTITMTIPLRSIIDNAMIVRAGGQLFALPMPSLLDGATEQTRDAQLAAALGRVATSEASDDYVVVEAHGLDVQGVRFQVDEMVGPEEVVVRPLPMLLRHQKLFSGVTLSGNGEIVLVIDPVVLTDAYIDGKRSLAVKPKTAYLPKHVLIVDDSLSARRATANLWANHGWDAVECADGAAGLEALGNNPFEAVVTDFDMPKMNGVEFIEAVRQQERLADLPIIMISSRQPEEMADVAKQAGASAYLQKPITEEKLQTILSDLEKAEEPSA